jgi:hypothetical protein
MTESTSLTKQPTKTIASLKFFLILAFLLLLVLLFYTFAHEGGHALLGLLFGGRVTAFSVNFFNLSAHVGLDGEFTTAQNAIISAGGVSLPYLLLLALIFRAPKNADPVLEWFKLLAFMGTVNSLLAWVVIPFLASNGQTIGDDSANFLRYTQFSPWLISGAALLVYLAGWAAYLSRAGGWSGLSNRLRSQAVDLSVPGSRKSFTRLVLAGAVVGAATLALTLALPDRFLEAPTGYQLAAEVDLSAKPITGETVYSFRLDEPSTVSLFIPLRKVKGAPVKIWLAGPDGYENAFLVNADPKFDAVQATVHPQDLPLGPGSYQICITAPQGPGSIAVYTLVE